MEEPIPGLGCKISPALLQLFVFIETIVRPRRPMQHAYSQIGWVTGNMLL